MDYDPYYEFGNQLFVIARDKNTYSYKSKRQIKRYVSLQNEKFRQLNDTNLLNEKDILFKEQSGDSTVLEFIVRRRLLPRKIKHIGDFAGSIYLINGEL